MLNTATQHGTGEIDPLDGTTAIDAFDPDIDGHDDADGADDDLDDGDDLDEDPAWIDDDLDDDDDDDDADEPRVSASPGPSADAAVSRAIDALRFYVERDRQNREACRRANQGFRSDRLMLGHQLNETRRGLTDSGFGQVLRGLGLNRHTAHNAMRMAREFSRPDGSLDLDLLRAARERNAGLLRGTRAGQRALDADPERLSVQDLRRIMGREKSQNTRTKATKCVDARQHTRASIGEVGPLDGPGARGAGEGVERVGPTGGHPSRAPAAQAPVLAVPAPARSPVVDHQLTLDFENTCDRARLALEGLGIWLSMKHRGGGQVDPAAVAAVHQAAAELLQRVRDLKGG